MIELILSNTNHVALSGYLFNLIQILLKGKTVLVGYYISVSMCELPSCRVGTYHSGQQGQLTSRLKDIRHVCVQPGCMIVYTVHHEVWSTDQSYNKKTHTITGLLVKQMMYNQGCATTSSMSRNQTSLRACAGNMSA